MTHDAVMGMNEAIIEMPRGWGRSVTLPKEIVDEVEKFLEVHEERLKRMGIKKISHVFERSWYYYKDYLEEHFNQR